MNYTDEQIKALNFLGLSAMEYPPVNPDFLDKFNSLSDLEKVQLVYHKPKPPLQVYNPPTCSCKQSGYNLMNDHHFW